MPLGPEVPEWAELRRVLTALTSNCKAHYAYVFDNHIRLWCTSEHVDWDRQTTLMARMPPPDGSG